VEKRAANVQVTVAAAHEEKCGRAVHDNADRSHYHDGFRHNRGRVHEPSHGFPCDAADSEQ
jgi:hypothetical protein